mmetsp:Transcript_33139/g.55834  ORF Transcript_33139/g.55834 Transcript_33139/m.55834 type:complete len:110 (-) Transcript_33139:218-547(-)
MSLSPSSPSSRRRNECMQLAIASKEKKAKFSNESSDPLAGPAAVVQTLSRLLQDYDLQSRFADVTLILRRGDSSFVELKTNRCILAAWSDRFRRFVPYTFDESVPGIHI